MLTENPPVNNQCVQVLKAHLDTPKQLLFPRNRPLT